MAAYMPNHQSLFLNSVNSNCNYCDDELFGPPPDDILFIPPPPLPPSMQAYLMPQRDLASESEATSLAIDSKCSYCSIFDNSNNYDSSVDPNSDHYISQSRISLLLISAIFIISAFVTMAYFLRTRKVKMFASQVKGSLFGSSQTSSSVASQKSTGSPRGTMPNHATHPTDPCLMPINLEKALSSQNIITDVPHKKTSIPSKYWAQPGTMRAGQISRIPNDYEIPSSRTNSTCTSSAVYADLTNKGYSQARLFSPYNMHTYAEVLEPNDLNNSKNPSNQVVIIPDSNYDNAVYSHGSIVTSNGLIGPNGSLQLTDFGSARGHQGVSNQFNTATNHHQIHPMANVQHNRPFTTLHQQPHLAQQRAQIIVTSNSQGCGPSLLNYEERMRDVI